MKMHTCKFSDPLCLIKPRRFGCVCGKGGGSPAPAPVDPAEQARLNVQAQVESIPRAAQLNFDVLNNPSFGLLPTTQLFENTRQQVFPNENAVRTQLVQNILKELQSPTGITPEQQSAIDTRRGQAQEEVTTALRNRANLGGGLFGGRSAKEELQAVTDLQNQFVEEDVARQERARLNNAQLALTVSQLLFPGSGIQQPNFINPVVSADTQFGGAVNQSNTAAQLQAQQQASNNALTSSLFQALGGAAGAYFGGPAGAAAGSQAGRSLA